MQLLSRFLALLGWVSRTKQQRGNETIENDEITRGSGEKNNSDVENMTKHSSNTKSGKCKQTKGRKKTRDKIEGGKNSDIKEKKTINLGDYTNRVKKKDTNKSKLNCRKQENKGLTIRSPFIEIDLDRAGIFLTIPSQQIDQSKINDDFNSLTYKLWLNDEKCEQDISVGVSNKQIVEKKKFELKEPLRQFKITFPEVLYGKNYCYHHKDEFLYLFIPIGNNRGRMFYLYDSEGGRNPLPKREIWALIKEDLYPYPEPNIVEESRIWESYQPMLIDLTNVSELVLKNRSTEKKFEVPCKSSFFLESEDVTIQDDFYKYNPLFTGNNIKLRTERNNPDGWLVEIQDNYGKVKDINQNWTGAEPLEISLPQDLPSDYGEFQIMISELDVELNEKILVELMTFRYIPHLSLEYPKDIIVPDPNNGHTNATVKVCWNKDSSEWELGIEGPNENVSKKIDNGYQIVIPPNENVVDFLLWKKSKPETKTKLRVTLPRLRWQVLDEESWSDKLVFMDRKQIEVGRDKYFRVSAAGYLTDYEMIAALKVGDEKIQEEKLVKKRDIYEILLNRFYDSIRNNQNELKLSVEIRKGGSNETLHRVEVIGFSKVLKYEAKTQLKEITKLKSASKIVPVVKGGNGKFRAGRGFSKSELGEVKIKIKDLKEARIYFDSRRRSSHQDNIKTLEAIKETFKNAD